MHAVLESYTSVVGSLHILNKIKQHNNICGERERESVKLYENERKTKWYWQKNESIISFK